MNLILALSNLCGIPALVLAEPSVKPFIFFAMLSSTVYHLGESKKHKLEGVQGFCEIQWVTLQLDRLSCLLLFYSLWPFQLQPLHFFILFINWAAELEGILYNNLTAYFLLHLLWHIGAYICLTNLIILKNNKT